MLYICVKYRVTYSDKHVFMKLERIPGELLTTKLTCIQRIRNVPKMMTYLYLLNVGIQTNSLFCRYILKVYLISIYSSFN